MNSGYVKLFRKIRQWKWYKNVKTFKAFIHCLLEANYTAKEYEKEIIPRGSFLTGRKKFADECGLTEQETRSAWTNLKSTNEITIKSTNKGTLITVVNYEDYQPLTEILTNEITSTLTNEQPTDNQQITTTKNNKNINYIYVCNNTACAHENICHFQLEEKCDGCVDCMKKNICKNPTSAEFLLKHGGQTFEEWNQQRIEQLNQMTTKMPQENLDLEILDYDFLEDPENIMKK